MEYKSERDGDKKFEKGKDAITTGIFQWSKDYASGAHNFQEAVELLVRAMKGRYVCGVGWAIDTLRHTEYNG